MTHPQWKYELDAKVRYRSSLGMWNEEPYRVIARTYTEMLHTQAPAVQYYLQPYTLWHQWIHDRPLAGIWEGDLEALEAPVASPSPLNEAQTHLDAALAILKGLAPPKDFTGVWIPQVAALFIRAFLEAEKESA